MDEPYYLSDPRRLMRIFLLACIAHGLFLFSIDFFPKALGHPIELKKVLTSTLEPLMAVKKQQAQSQVAVKLSPNSGKTSFVAKKSGALTDTDAKSVKKRTISGASHQSKDVRYLGQWQGYIEEFGNRHYPEQLLRNNIHGDLRLLVAINRDGSLRDIQIRQSSGSPILDAAAIQIVKNAAPFDPLPDEIAADTEVLEIIRTWQFRGKLSTS